MLISLTLAYILYKLGASVTLWAGWLAVVGLRLVFAVANVALTRRKHHDPK